jgi:hypothetical protein
MEAKGDETKGRIEEAPKVKRKVNEVRGVVRR